MSRCIVFLSVVGTWRVLAVNCEVVALSHCDIEAVSQVRGYNPLPPLPNHHQTIELFTTYNMVHTVSLSKQYCICINMINLPFYFLVCIGYIIMQTCRQSFKIEKKDFDILVGMSFLGSPGLKQFFYKVYQLFCSYAALEKTIQSIYTKLESNVSIQIRNPNFPQILQFEIAIISNHNP